MPTLTTTHRGTTLGALLLVVALVAGCSGGSAASPGVTSDPATATAPAPDPTPEASASPDATASPDADPTATASSATVTFEQPWANAPLTDVATGEVFTIGALAASGRTVIVETMAIWCSNCFRQQGHVYEALGSLDAERVAYVLIDVDPNETAEALAEYRDRNGFTGRYAVASSDVARGLAEAFGDQVLNPPAVPMLLVAPDGRVTLAEFGGHSPDEVIELARAHGA